MPQKNVFIVSKDVHLSSCWSVNKHLSVNMLFKYCLVWSVRRRVWKKKKKSLLRALCCYFAPPHGAIMYPKTPAFSTAEIGKNIKHMWWHKAIPKTKTVLCFVSFVLFFFISLRLFSSSFYCCIQKHHQVCATARRLPLARPGCVTSVTWHRDTAHWQ